MSTAETETGESKTEEVNPLAMSDEDILNMAGPGMSAVTPEPAAEDPPATSETPTGEEAPAEKPADAPAAAEGEGDPPGSSEAPVAAAEGDKDPADPNAPAAEETAPDYEGFYKQIMTPFKANGKQIELKDPAEAIQLMQMGANYTRKMQELVPHRKALTMLQNNQINEEKLSFLIDLDKKNPEAIKKLIKDSGIDPMEIDTAVEPAYLGGNHRVTDEEVNFRSALEELSSAPGGQTTLQDINTRWDQASKDVLWKNPETMAIIHEQREYGIYDRIVAEMDRQVTLGKIQASTPFLQAYKIVGDQLTAAGAFADLVTQRSGNAPSGSPTPPGQVETKAAPQAVATRVATPKPTVKNSDAASAASPTRAAPTPAQAFINPLAMSDDEFLKQFNGRL